MERSAKMVEMLAQLVEIESNSYHKDGVDQLGRLLISYYKPLGFHATVYEQNEYGNHIVLRHQSAIKEPKFLLLAHLDTVFPKGTIQERPFRVEENVARGPGVADMKGSHVTTYFAMKELLESGREEALSTIEILLTSDEEIGAPSARPIIEKHALGKRAVFVMEPARQDGSLVTFRRGGGRYRLSVQGIAAHSGNDPEKGASAIEELAHKTIAVHNLSNQKEGIQLNVGLIKGGTAVNTIADYAEAEVDVRTSKVEQATQIEEAIKHICAKTYVKGTQTHVQGGVTRPPMERTIETRALFETVKTIAGELGFTVGEVSAGGGSDASFTSTLGVPTLDGMGPIGGGFHGENEWLFIPSLEERTTLLTQTLLHLSKVK